MDFLINLGETAGIYSRPFFRDGSFFIIKNYILQGGTNMHFVSTRGCSEKIKGSKAIVNGLCSDGGLYVPTEFPYLKNELNKFINLSYKELCLEILKLFFDDFTENELKSCINKAYDHKFDTEIIAPTKKNKRQLFFRTISWPNMRI